MDVAFDTAEIRNLAKKCQDELNLCQQVFDQYIKILNDVTSRGLVKGAAKEGLKATTDSMKRAFGDGKKFKEAGQNIQSLATNFLLEVNIADGFMYL